MDWLFSHTLSAAQATLLAALVSGAVALGVAMINPFAARNLEKLKAELGQKSSVEAAKLAYEFEARNRLYTRIAPLLFQLTEAAEGSYYRIVNIVGVRSSEKVERLAKSALLLEDGSLNRKNYYLSSTLYKIFLPLAIYRLLQRSATFFDFTLDDEIRAKYFLLKTAFICFTDDHELSETEPKLKYTPNLTEWRTLRELEPALCWRQGLVTGHLEQLCDAMIVGTGDGQRPMTYGEFEKAAFMDGEFQRILNPPSDLFLGFRLETRPVFSRVLLAQAGLMRLLFLKFVHAPGPEELLEGLRSFAKSHAARQDLQWWDEKANNWAPVLIYLTKQINWIFPEGSTPDF